MDVYSIIYLLSVRRVGVLFGRYIQSMDFFLRFDRHNYNKAPLVFLSDVFYWMENDHPILNVLTEHLVKFSDYPVENMHSIIRRHSSSLDSAEQLSRKAKIADLRKTMDSFKEVFVTKRNDFSSNKERLLPLTTKMKVFCFKRLSKFI